MQNPMISAWLSGRSSSTDPLSRVSRSLDSVLGELMCSIRNVAISASSPACSPGVRSVLSMTASDHRRKRARSASATPNISAMTVIGMGAATSSTNSMARAGGHRGEDAGHHLTDPVGQGGHRPRRELPVDEGAVGAVQGRVEVEDGPGVPSRPRRVPQGIVDQHPAPGHEAGRVAADGADVLVPADGQQPVGRTVEGLVAPEEPEHVEVVGAEEESRFGEAELRLWALSGHRLLPAFTRAARTRRGRWLPCRSTGCRRAR